MPAPDGLLALALVRAGFLRPRERVTLARALGSAAALAALGGRDLEALLGRPLRRECPGRELLDRAAEDVLRLTRNGIGCIFLGESDYPPSLAEIYDPPLVLFTRGRLPPAAGRGAVAVVGTRRPTAAAGAAARATGRALAQAGLTVVSGLARGIDGEAHRGALAAGGPHVAVLGSGLERIHPASNAELGRRILRAGGALVSEQPPDEPPRKHHFPARNRIISGLCRAVVVVQAPERSGALITVDFALEHGRDVFVHAAGIGGSRGAGGEALVDSGARLLGGGAELLRELGVEGAAAPDGDETDENGERIAGDLERELDGLD